MKKAKTIISMLRAVALGAVTLAMGTVHAQVLYKDATGNQNANFDDNANWSVGNEVVLAGTASSDYVNQFAFQYNLSPAAGASGVTPSGFVQITFYKNDGAPFNTYPTPGTVLWQSSLVNIGAAGFTSPTLGTITFLPGQIFGGAGVTVPQDFTWVASFTGIASDEEAGLSIYSPPTVGANYADAWVDTGSGWTLEQSVTGPPLEFGAIISNVPDEGPGWVSVATAAACLAAFSKLIRRETRA